MGSFLSGSDEEANTVRESVGRFFYDNLATYTLPIIMIEIVGGIIIDTFSSLRE